MQQLPASHKTAKALPPKPHRPPKSVKPPKKRGPSNLDFKTPLKSRDGKVPIKALKCACRKAWCQTCGKLSAIKRFIEYIRDWDYRYVRQIILTVDRDLYSSPEEALNTIKGKKHIAALIRNLERTKKIGILDWAWILEWHRDGYPHWHLFILVDKAGQAGQIGFRNIGQYWKSGRIEESFIRDEKHWRHFTSYFEKHGYFDKKKAHQSILPEWARNQKQVIRRVGRKARSTERPDTKSKEKFLADEEARENPDKERVGDILKSHEIGLWFQEQAKKKELTEGEKLDRCGCETDLYLGPAGYFYLTRVNISYQEFRSMKGEYIDGVGYIVEMDHDQLNDFIRQNMAFVNMEWVNDLIN